MHGFAVYQDTQASDISRMVSHLFHNGPAMSIRRCSRFLLGSSLEPFNQQRFEQLWQSSISFIIHSFRYIPLRPYDLSKRHLKPSTKTNTCLSQKESMNISTYPKYMPWSIMLQPFNPVDRLMDLIPSHLSSCT